MNVRQAIIAGLRHESILLPKVTKSLRTKAEDDSSALAALVQAALCTPVSRSSSKMIFSGMM